MNDRKTKKNNQKIHLKKKIKFWNDKNLSQYNKNFIALEILFNLQTVILNLHLFGILKCLEFRQISLSI